MSQIHSTAYGLPFCHSSQEEQRSLSPGLKVSTLVLGIIEQKPLVAPRQVKTQGIDIKLNKQFHKLKKAGTIWMGEERDEVTIGKCVGKGGSKNAKEMKIDLLSTLRSLSLNLY